MMLWKYFFNRAEKPALTLATTVGLKFTSAGWKNIGRWLLPVLRMAAVVFFIIALARPQNHSQSEEVTTEGIDIVISMDISGSMLAQDFKPNRIDGAINLASKFIDNRPNDRIGLVIFSGESFTQCPITTDHSVLKNLFKDVKSGMIEDGTAIGMGLATAVDRLKESKAKSRVVILMTDGVNNTGLIDPETGFELAKTYGIRVYTIGIGAIGYAPYPMRDAYGNIHMQNIEVQIDEPLMRRIATETGGEYFRATTNDKLKQVYEKIDKLEKTKIEVTSFKHYAEEYLWFVLIGATLLLLELAMRYSIFKTFP
jgi:Ca-activated chloride channel homolog